MIITSIERQKNNENRYSIFIDGKFSFGLSGEDVLFYKLAEGGEIDEKTLDFLKNEIEFTKARDCAVRHIGCRMRSEREVACKLRSGGYDEGTIEKIITLLKGHDYLNDIKFCLAYINEKTKLNGFGKIRITYDLQQRGVSKDDINNAYLLFEQGLEKEQNVSLPEMELEQASKALRKKYGGNITEPKEKKQAYDFLARRGFSNDTICKCLRLSDDD